MESLSLEDLYLNRPTLEYSQAFDLFAKDQKDQQSPILAVLSSAVLAVELLKRCSVPLHIARKTSLAVDPFIEASQGWAWGSITSVDLDEGGSNYNSIIWAEPEAGSGNQIAAILMKRAQAKGNLWVIASAPMRRYLPAWKVPPYPAVHPLDSGRVRGLLKKNGWQVQEWIVFHGPRSIAWTSLARMCYRIGRPDWGDRCILTMRSQYREPGYLWPLTPLALIHARAA